MKKLIEKIKNYLMKVSLARVLSKKFHSEIKKIIIDEEKNDDKYNHDDYTDCYGRAEAMIKAAVEPVIKILAYAIAHHREKCHDENYSREKVSLSKGMTASDIGKSTKSWWER